MPEQKKQTVKVKQIAVTSCPDSPDMLYALCKDSSIWLTWIKQNEAGEIVTHWKQILAATDCHGENDGP